MTIASFGEAWLDEFQIDFLADRGNDEVDVELGASLCTGNCAKGPVVIVNGRTYTNVDRGVMKDLLEKTFPKP